MNASLNIGGSPFQQSLSRGGVSPLATDEDSPAFSSITKTSEDGQIPWQAALPPWLLDSVFPNTLSSTADQILRSGAFPQRLSGRTTHIVLGPPGDPMSGLDVPPSLPPDRTTPIILDSAGDPMSGLDVPPLLPPDRLQSSARQLLRF